MTLGPAGWDTVPLPLEKNILRGPLFCGNGATERERRRGEPLSPVYNAGGTWSTAGPVCSWRCEEVMTWTTARSVARRRPALPTGSRRAPGQQQQRTGGAPIACSGRRLSSQRGQLEDRGATDGGWMDGTQRGVAAGPMRWSRRRRARSPCGVICDAAERRRGRGPPPASTP